MRVDAADGTSLVYSADTGPGLVDRPASARGVDLALIEATYGTDAEAEGIKHLLGRPGRRAWPGRPGPGGWCSPTSGPGRTWPVHARNGEAAYGAPVTIASPNERYTL